MKDSKVYYENGTVKILIVHNVDGTVREKRYFDRDGDLEYIDIFTPEPSKEDLPIIII